jgi:hypothetical protein
MERPITSQGKPLNKENIYETLFMFIDDVLFKYKLLASEIAEDKITQDIEIYLNEETRVNNTFFAFQNQHKEGIYTTDIGVYLRNTRNFFCWIEAKRLPTPDIEKDRDEREYVIVNKNNEKFRGNGGIQRFKEGKHASKLEYSIMIGYIQDDNNADYWLSKINTWITDLANIDNIFWSHEDLLKKFVSNKCDRFLSVHKRNEKTPIILHHYWIKL